MPSLGRVLLEAAEINRIRSGADHPTTARAYETVGMFFVVLREYDKAESSFRECLAYWKEKEPGQWDRFLNEIRLGVSLLAQRKYTEARSHFLAGYNGIRRSQGQPDSPEEVDLGRLIGQVARLRDADGHSIIETTMLPPLHIDPNIQDIVLDLEDVVLDLQFPVFVFAP